MSGEPAAKRSNKKGLLERLAEGVVIGDGGMIWAMELKGYAEAGKYTPEAAVEHPEAVLQMHREFVHNGAEVLQTCTFWSSKLEEETVEGVSVNDAACALALKAAKEASDPILVAGSVTKTDLYEQGESKEVVQAEFRRQLDFYVRNDFDFVIAEFFDHVLEAEWAVEVLKESGKPVLATVCIGPEGDADSFSPEQCALRLARAGADVVGVNCRFGPQTCLKTVAMMKRALKLAKLDHVYLAVQPYGYHTPDAPINGYSGMKEFPFAMDARVMTRIDAYNYAKEASKLGVRYIGGCCGFEGRHIRSMSEALQGKTGRIAPVTKRYGKWINTYADKDDERADAKHWLEMKPATGRPKSSAMSASVKYS
eukprot:scpid39551/ scgid13859/ Betaine--homocysteine S-methyltransferase 1